MIKHPPRPPPCSVCVSHEGVLTFQFLIELRESHIFILHYKQRVVGNKLIAVKSTPSLPYLPTFMSCYFSHVLVNCMHAIHFPKAPRRIFSSERSDWGRELYGRYISVQKRSTRRVGPVSVIYSKSKSPVDACCQSQWHHLWVTSKQLRQRKQTQLFTHSAACSVLSWAEEPKRKPKVLLWH